MFKQGQLSMAQDDRTSQRNLMLAYVLFLPLFAYGLFRVIKHWHTPGYEHGPNLAWVLLMGFSAILNIVVRLVKLRKLPT
jgi:hypothetical protein